MKTPAFLARRSAFTLVEVVLVMAFLGMLSIVTYQLFDGAQRFYRRGKQFSNSLDGRICDRERVFQQLFNVQPWPRPWTEDVPIPQRQLYFEGNAVSMRFISPFSMTSPPDGLLRLVQWDVARNPEGGEGGIRVTEWAIRPRDIFVKDLQPRLEVIPDFPFDLSDPTELSLGLQRSKWRFEYFGQDIEGEFKWVEEWDSKNSRILPESVRISGQFSSDSANLGHFVWVVPLVNRGVGWPPYIARKVAAG